jgi:ABC-2 type transport system ATP-binding protein
MIKAENLTKVYGKTTVLRINSLEITEGESFGLVGNNGAGKTTFFSLVVDLIKASSGKVISKGEDVFLSNHWKKYTGSFLDESFLIDFLSPEEYFEFIGSLHSISKQDVGKLLELYADFFNGEILGRKKFIRDLSKGNQKKVGIVGALLFQPEILILDEPFPHLDPTSVIRLKKILKDEKVKNCTLLISSHDLNHVTDVCDRIAVLEKGDIIHDLKTSSSTLKELEAYFTPEEDFNSKI